MLKMTSSRTELDIVNDVVKHKGLNEQTFSSENPGRSRVKAK